MVHDWRRGPPRVAAKQKIHRSWLGLGRSGDGPGVFFEFWSSGLNALRRAGRRLQRGLIRRMGGGRRLPMNVVLQSLQPLFELDHAFAQRPSDVRQSLAEEQDGNDPD